MKGAFTFTFASLVNTAKRYALNASLSEEDFLNAFIGPYVSVARVKGRGGIEFHLDKSRTSRILRGKADVPKALRRDLARYGLEDRVADAYQPFVDEQMDPHALGSFERDILDAVASDDAVSSETKAYISEARGDCCLLMARLLIESLKIDNIRTSEVLIWKGKTGSLWCRSGDLLDFGFRNRKRSRNLIVVPVDTSFEVHVTRAYEGIAKHKVAESSLHGQWLTRMMQSGHSEEELSQRIGRELARTFPERIDGHRYPMGTVAVIEERNAVYLLVALSEFDDEGRASSTAADVALALESTLSFYDIHGQGSDLYLPLIGTGRSRAGMSPQESFETICQFVSSPASSIYGKLTIVVRPETVKELGLALRE